MFHHNCGIASSYKDPNLKANLYKLAISLNHRGEEGTGLCVDVGGSFLVLKGTGLVRDVFPRLYRDVDFRSDTGFIHNRYSTAGSSTSANLHPIRVGRVAVGHNGTLINARALRERYSGRYSFRTETDSEIIACVFDDAGGDLLEGARRCMEECEGSYNLLVMNDRGDMIAVRDPWAVHPFVWTPAQGETAPAYTASEDCALRALSIYDDRRISEIEPGTAVLFSKSGDISVHGIHTGERLRRCFFEPLYFMSYGSTHKGRLVSDIRIACGEALGRKIIRKGIKADAVGIMRDSGSDYAEGVHRATGLPVVDVFVRNRYVGRTYMSPDGKGEDVPKALRFSRQDKAALKNPPIPSRVRGMRIIVPDDSQVRGNTSRGTNRSLFEAGALEVHEAVAAPPIRYPCFLGMDHADRSMLVAAKYNSIDDAELGVARDTGATTTTYLGAEDLRPILNDDGDHEWGCVCGDCGFTLPPELAARMEKG